MCVGFVSGFVVGFVVVVRWFLYVVGIVSWGYWIVVVVNVFVDGL